MRYRFPDNFWWGSACSALQTEGDSLNGGKSQDHVGCVVRAPA